MINADGSVDIAFGPEQRAMGRTGLPRFPDAAGFDLRFKPHEAYFDKTWSSGHRAVGEASSLRC
jgi:hypothetical protein